jgi:hypothetical protein
MGIRHKRQQLDPTPVCRGKIGAGGRAMALIRFRIRLSQGVYESKSSPGSNLATLAVTNF